MTRSELPMNAPTRPPLTPASTVTAATSGSSSAGHGSGIQTCDQPHSAAVPIVPISRPATAPNASGPRLTSTNAAPSTSSASAR